MTKLIISAVAALALAACGNGGPTPGGNVAQPAQASVSPAGWNAMDACATTGTATVAAASGSAVTGTETGPKVEPQNGLAGFSMCTFNLANGAKMSVLTREAPDDDATDAAIAEARTIGREFGAQAEDVPGLGRAAIWTDKPAALQVFLDGRRYATISMFGENSLPDASEAARKVAITVARKLVS